MTNPDIHLIGDNELEAITVAMRNDDETALALLDDACRLYPADARLRLLRGSVHASSSCYAEARNDFADCLALAPDAHIARFMLGYLELVNGEKERALQVWVPLDAHRDIEISNVARGMALLANDRLDEASECFRSTLSQPTGHPEIVQFLERLVHDIEAARGKQVMEEGSHLLLSGYQTRH